MTSADNDIVERLRALSRREHDDLSIGDEAADEIVRLRGEVESLRGQIHDEIAANLAFREAGGALPDEDMPTFCARLLAERDAAIAPAEAKGDACNCPGGDKRDPEKHAPNCPVRLLPCRTLVNPFDTPQPASGEAVAYITHAANHVSSVTVTEAGMALGYGKHACYTTPPAAQAQLITRDEAIADFRTRGAQMQAAPQEAEDAAERLYMAHTQAHPRAGRVPPWRELAEWERAPWIKAAHPSACELVAAACSWRKQDEYGDHVSTGCGHEFVLNDAGDFKDGEPVFPFCCYCAKPTVFRQWQDEPECACDNGDGPECFACSDRRARAALQHRGDSRGGEG